ncbi:MAG: HIT domain-containing protein, partial [Sulfuricella sp.]
MSDCLFCKIVAGEIPCRKVYEDGELIAFHDVNPAAPVHFMIVPKEHIASLEDCHARHEMLLGRILL